MKKKAAKKSKKLMLKKQTVRVLTNDELKGVGGGYGDRQSGTSGEGRCY